MSSSVKIYIDLPVLPQYIAANINQVLGARVKNYARELVAVSTEKTRPGGPHGVLRNSIQAIKISPVKTVVIADTEYAPAQEWGLAKYGKPNYTYTPYMRPAKDKVMTPGIFNAIAQDAIQGAIIKAKRRGTM